MINPKIIKVIKESANIIILSHIAPDGDSIGSSLALFNALIKHGKNAKFVLDDVVPEIYKFLAGADEVEKPSNNYDYDVVIVLDSGDIGRLGKSAKYLNKKSIINIDHHISNTSFGTHNMIDSNAAATAEIVYNIIRALGIDIDKDIAECLYTGIVTDTGQFQYSNT
ncbi:MAG: bifunctional oligoribonuclease/PAP phosphatase NrnA, partial [Gottschalkiaceae bacterium]